MSERMQIDLGLGVQYGMVPKAVTVAPMDRSAKVVFQALAAYADTAGECWPTQGTLAHDLDSSREFVTRWISFLVEKGWVERIPQGRDEAGRQRPNRYSLRPAWDRERARYAQVTDGSPGDPGITSHVTQGSHGPGDPPITQTNQGLTDHTNTAREGESNGGNPWPSAVGGVVVKDHERDLADAILAEFNRQAGTAYSRTADLRRLVVTRIREHPDLTLDQHALMIEAVLAHPWWKDEPPTPRVVYGHSRIEQAREYLSAAEHAGQAKRARAQEIERSMADRAARHQAEETAARSPEAREAARAVRAALPGARR